MLMFGIKTANHKTSDFIICSYFALFSHTDDADNLDCTFSSRNDFLKVFDIEELVTQNFVKQIFYDSFLVSHTL